MQKTDEFPYLLIECNGRVIAKFAHKSDRDICADRLSEEYPDREFEYEDKEENDD